jgi:hypothetical protein
MAVVRATTHICEVMFYLQSLTPILYAAYRTDGSALLSLRFYSDQPGIPSFETNAARARDDGRLNTAETAGFFCNLDEQELESMKRILEIGAYKAGNLRLEVVDLTDLQETVNENTAVFVDPTTVTSRIRGQDYSGPYHISRAYLKQQSQWRLVASQRARVARRDVRAANDVRSAAA